MSNVLLKSVLINTAIAGGMIFGSLHYLGNRHHETFKEFYDKHRKPDPSPCPYMAFPSPSQPVPKKPVLPPQK